MTPERVARLVAAWARFYTRGLPAPIARRRIEEIDADLHEHIAHDRAHGTKDRRIAVGIAGRMLRGMPADASWRGQAIGRPTLSRSVTRIALVTAFVLLLPLVGMVIGAGFDWGVFDFVFAGALVAGTGLLYELAARRPGSMALRVGAVAVGAAAIVFGEADDAPGLVLFGGLVVLSTVALAFRAAARSG